MPIKKTRKEAKQAQASVATGSPELNKKLEELYALGEKEGVRKQFLDHLQEAKFQLDPNAAEA